MWLQGEQGAIRTAESRRIGEPFGLLDVEAYVESSRQHVRTVSLQLLSLQGSPALTYLVRIRHLKVKCMPLFVLITLL